MIERRVYLPERDKHRIIGLFIDGAKIPALAQLFGVSEGTIYRFTKHLRETTTRKNRGSILARARHRIGIW